MHTRALFFLVILSAAVPGVRPTEWLQFNQDRIERSGAPAAVFLKPFSITSMPGVMSELQGLNQFWEDLRSKGMPLWKVTCGVDPDNEKVSLCRSLQPSSFVQFQAWDGFGWNVYKGEKSTAGLLEWLSAALRPQTYPEGATPLYVASLRGRLHQVNQLLTESSFGGGVNIPTRDGRTPLYAAASNNQVKIMQLLLDAGASVEIDRWEPLLIAMREGHFAGAQKILGEHGISMPKDSVKRNNIADETKIRRPKIIHLTYSSRDEVDPKVWSQFERYAEEYDLRFYDDDECLAYLDSHAPKRVVEKYLELEMPAHRADLFRYVVMYREGGVYLDIKTVLVRHLDEVFPDQQQLYTVLSKRSGYIHQGVLASPPRNRVFLKLINLLVKTPRFKGQGTVLSKWDKGLYLSFTKQFYDLIHKKIKDGAPLQVGQQPKLRVHLYKENCYDNGEGGCSKGDRYGDCCTIRNHVGRIMFVTRFQDYHLDRSMKQLQLAKTHEKMGLFHEADQAFYSAVDHHQGNWEAWLLWGLHGLNSITHLNQMHSIETAASVKQKAVFALQQSAVAIHSYNDPRRIRLLKSLISTGHAEFALEFLRMFENRFVDALPDSRPVGKENANQPERAYVTLITTPSYFLGAAALAESIKKPDYAVDSTEKYLVALVTKQADLDHMVPWLLAVGYDEVIRVEAISCNTLTGPSTPAAKRLTTACTKLQIFDLTQFKYVVYLDADVLVLNSSVEDLFKHGKHLTDERPFAAGPESLAPTLFNTGVLLVKPSTKVFSFLFDELQNGIAYDKTDQGYLNHMYSDWFTWDSKYRLPFRFNFPQVVAYIDMTSFSHYEKEGIIVLHFLGSDKPWHAYHELTHPYAGTQMEPYHRLWQKYCNGALSKLLYRSNLGFAG